MAENSHNQTDPVIEKHGRLSPERLLELVGDRIVHRIKFLEQTYNQFIDQWPGVYLNPYLLREAVESYFCDVYRLKFFRPVNLINEHKKAAYTMKWIARIRPVQMVDGTGPSLSIMMVNAYYALAAGLALLDIDFDARSDMWWKSYITHTVYTLHYHSVSVESLTQEMCVLHALDAEWKSKGNRRSD